MLGRLKLEITLALLIYEIYESNAILVGLQVLHAHEIDSIDSSKRTGILYVRPRTQAPIIT